MDDTENWKNLEEKMFPIIKDANILQKNAEKPNFEAREVVFKIPRDCYVPEYITVHKIQSARIMYVPGKNGPAAL